MLRHFIYFIQAIILVLSFFNKGNAQPCGPLVPSYTVNFSGNPNGTWISPVTIKSDTCCGVATQEKCVEFIITLDPSAVGVFFNIYSGSPPPGSLFYQVDCGFQVPLGTASCLSGPGPHQITFCTQTSDPNEYIIKSIAPQQALYLSEGCTGTMYSFGYDESTVTWTSVFPGPNGTHDTYLSCTAGCDTTTVTPQAGFPAYVDYQVCGTPLFNCPAIPLCDTIRVYLTPPLSVALPASVSICAGSTSTIIAAAASGGTPAYTYVWSTGETTQSASLGVGTHTVIVIDSALCDVAVASVTVVQNPAINITLTTNNAACNSLCNGSASVSVSGGLPGYTYAWSPSGGTTSAVTGLCAGNHLITVTDALGCFHSVEFSIIQPPPLASTATLTTGCNGSSSGSATVSLSGGTPNYTYSWSSGHTTFTATGLATGGYTVTITDSKGCTTVQTFTVTQSPTLSSTPSQTSVLCNGSNTGSATVNPSGGTPAFTYSWSNGQTTSTATGLTQGNYTVTTTDAAGCTHVTVFNITESPAITYTTSQTNVSCSGANNGSASVNPSGGTPNYTYLWSNGGSTSTESGLTIGNYNVTISDANGCTTTHAFVITQANPLTAVPSQTDILCNGVNNGSATATTSGGTPNYTYAWSNGQSTSTATGLAIGNYSVLITDANGCTTTNAFVITQATPLVSVPSQKNSCSGANTASATVNLAGGTPVYTYAWSNGQSTSTATGLAIGNYSVLITDANGCTTTNAFVIIQAPALTSVPSQKNSCSGGNTGTATVVIGGGTPAYTYSWSNGQTAPTATGLGTGNYTVTTADANGCTTTNTFIIIQPPALTYTASQTNVLCNGQTTGDATVNMSGGTPAYTYLWSNGQLAATATGLPPGNYNVTITDANGCTNTNTFTITQPPPIAIIPTQTNVPCNGGSTGTATVNVAGGTPGYGYTWSNGQATQTATGLAAGNYNVIINDANGCTKVSTFSITQPVVLSSVPSQKNSCDGGSTGSATVNVSGGTPAHAYLWSNGQVTPTVTGLALGTYSVLITDANGCTKVNTFVIIKPPPLSATIPQTNVTCFGGNNGTAFISPNGGTPGYTYLWSNGAMSGAISGLSAGVHNVLISDANGCVLPQSITITQPPPIIMNTKASGSSCNGSTNGVATVTSVSGGASGLPYTYLWLPGTQTTSSIGNLAGGTYTILVTDGRGCTEVSTVTIPSSIKPVANFNAQQSVSCDGLQVQFQDASSNASIWSWDFGDGTTSSLKDPFHIFPFNGSYNVTLIITDPPCGDTSTATVINASGLFTIGTPNVFTPNADLSNDCFLPILSGTASDSLKDCMQLEIFDRWGIKTFESDNSKKCWDGTRQDKTPARSGTYYYIISLGETTVRGYVTLMR